jgi:hypothetical protein
MNWFVFRDGQTYGPYDLVALGAFLVPDDQVCAEGSSTWVRAGDQPEFSVFFGAAPPAAAKPGPGEPVPELDWFFGPAGKPERGPVSWDALKRMLDRSELTAKDAVRHSSWKAAHPLSNTKLFRLWKTDKVPLNLLPLDQIVREPDAIAAAVATVAPVTAAPPGGGWRGRLADFRDTSWKVKALLVFLCFLPPVGYFGYKIYYQGSETDIHMRYGTPTGNCKADEVSNRICTEVSPGSCGCNPKGACGMPGCVYFGKVNKHAPN